MATNTLVRVQPGAGGRESWAWATKLLRMYTLWAERNGFDVQRLDTGLELVIDGAAYEKLKGEEGVHSMKRVSPFDAKGRRHTSFARVLVHQYSDAAGPRRSYVFDPYLKVTDHVSGVETAAALAVLEGQLELLAGDGGQTDQPERSAP